MTPRSLAFLVALLTAIGCFRDGTPGSESFVATPPGPLAVRDRDGAIYPTWAAPRDPVLVLAVGDTPPSPAQASSQTALASALLLLRGQFDAGLAARLKRATKHATVAQSTVALRIESDARELRLLPLAALAPGADYTLFWLGTQSEVYLLSVSPAPALGARLVETWPSQHAIVAPNLQRALLRFDGDVADELAPHIVLHALGASADQGGADPLAESSVSAHTETVRCAALGFPDGDCAWLRPAQALRPDARYRLVVDGSLRTRTGAPLAERQIDFTTSRLPDQQPPSFVAVGCARDEASLSAVCLRVAHGHIVVHGALDEAALLTLQSADDGSVRSVSALSYGSAFELALEAPAGSSRALLRALDLAGNVVELALPFTPAPDLAALSIDEVLADPRGKEPAQEWVELLNYALTPSSLMGFTLSTDPGQRGRAITGAVVLAPRERALLVGPDFDPRDLADGVLPAGVRLLALDGPLSLANAGATLYLRDALGRRVSTGHVLSPLLEGQCSARLPERVPDHAALAETPVGLDPTELPGRHVASMDETGERAFALDPAGGCTPGAATTFGAGAESPHVATVLRSRAQPRRASINP